MSTLMVDAMTAAMANAATPKKEERTDEGRSMMEKQFSRVDKFAGTEKLWQDWSFDMKTAVNGVTDTLGKLMRSAEESKVEKTADQWEREDPITFRNVGKRSKELYGILVLLTTDEAKLLVKGVTSGCGLAAWWHLVQRYGRKSMAKTMRQYKDIINPVKAKNMSEVITVITNWEMKLKEISLNEEIESVSSMIKLAALTEMVPEEIQQFIYQTVDEADMTYEKMRDKVLAWTSNRAAAVQDVLEHIGHVQEDHPEGYDEEGYEIHSMTMQCYSCGGKGHPARLCPSKGQGKGGGGFGGGFGKGGKGDKGGKGGGKGGGGKGAWIPGEGGGGKGYQGDCWQCGKKGHKAAGCRSALAAASKTDIVQEEDEMEVQEHVTPVGGVWRMAYNVEVVHKNSFDGMEVTDSEDLDEMVCKSCEWEMVGGRWKKEKKKRGKNLQGPCSRAAFSQAAAAQQKGIKEVLIANVSLPKDTCAMNFHVTDAIRILASVNKLVVAGNEVVFKAEGSYIKHCETGTKAMLLEENGLYMLDVMVVNGEVVTPAKIIVDSGAAENVMPNQMFRNVEMRDKKKGVRFMAANGKEMSNYGQKDLTFVPKEFWKAAGGGAAFSKAAAAQQTAAGFTRQS